MPASPRSTRTAAAPRLDVLKTCKLFINGAFPRSESGRSLPVTNARGETIAHVAHASRKDLRDAVEAARTAQPKWAGATPYNRGQILYRLAEMMEGKRDELASALAMQAPGTVAKRSPRSAGVRTMHPRDEVSASIDRMVHYAGWCDKYAQVLGCHNPVAGPYYNFTVPEATGVVGVVCGDAHPILGLVSLLAPVLAPGNAAIVIAPESAPIASIVLAEAIATSDLPAGVVNILTGQRAELLSPLAQHRDVDAIHGDALPPDQARTLREGSAENLKRVTIRSQHDWASPSAQGPHMIEAFVEFKTIWHPALA